MRYRKSVNLGGGVRLNLNKKSVSVSAGVEGARVTVNSKGRRTTTLSAPGTGLSYRATSSAKGSARTGSTPAPTPQAATRADSLPAPRRTCTQPYRLVSAVLIPSHG